MNSRSSPNPAAAKLPLFAQFRTRLVLLVLLGFVPSMALVIHANFKQRATEKAKARESLMALAKLSASNQENFIKNARQLLVTLAEFPFLVGNPNRAVSQTHFMNLRRLLPDYFDFGLIESNGMLFCSIQEPNDVVHAGARSYFRRVIATRRFEVGDFQPESPDEQRTIGFGFPILNEDGHVHRVLYASLQLDLLNSAVAQIDLPSEAVVTVFDRRGHILARHPGPENWVGQSMEKEPLVQKVLSLAEGIFQTRGIDGISRVYAVAPVLSRDSPSLFVSVGVPTEISFAGANNIMIHSLLLFGIVAVVALSACHFYSRRFLMEPVSVLLQTATALAQGNFSARTGILAGQGELNELAANLDAMAARLQNRQMELENAQAENGRIHSELERRVKDRTVELEQANRELESFSYSVSHDLRAPLRHIQGYGRMLKLATEGQLSEKAQRYLKTITDASVEMGQLIDDLLAFSRMGRVEVNESRIALEEAVQATIRDLEMSTEGRNIIWKICPLPDVWMDPVMLKQVLANLIGNAVKYTRHRDPAEIEIGCAGEEDGRLIFFVRDNGAGFDMKYSHKLFGVFQRLHRADEFEGTGIGLATVQRIVSRHGGRAWAEGMVDQGAAFYFTLKPSPIR